MNWFSCSMDYIRVKEKQPQNTENLQETSLDRLSYLSAEILDFILEKLPMKDAIKTSILSKEWRYNWCSVSQLTIDWDGRKGIWYLISSTINQYLLNHDGNIDKLSFRSRYIYSDRTYFYWIDVPSRKGVRELVFEMQYSLCTLTLPCSLFACQQLNHLQLFNCEIKLPEMFQGFKFLASLNLHPVRISQNDLERVILDCAALERLTLLRKVLGILPASTSRMLRLEIDVNKLQTFILECPAALKRLPLLRIWNLLGHLLKIDAPNLKSVELDSMPTNNSSERSRHLANACPYLMADHVNEDKSKNFILSCPSLERLAQLRHLKIHGPNLKYPEVGTGLENISIENTLNL
ncbi:hypothetical protein QUC31_017520, partial [Theobroma cacao]